jgi:hypothetical protein
VKCPPTCQGGDVAFGIQTLELRTLPELLCVWAFWGDLLDGLLFELLGYRHPLLHFFKFRALCLFPIVVGNRLNSTHDIANGPIVGADHVIWVVTALEAMAAN